MQIFLVHLFAEEKTWAAQNETDRPLVNLTNMDHSPTVKVALEYSKMLCAQPQDALDLLHGYSVCVILRWRDAVVL